MSEKEFLQTAQDAARRAAGVLQSWADRFTVSEKSPANLVTEADFAAQDAIHRQIRERYPDHGFLAEEGLEESSSDSPYRWVIDPLDGTSNYVHRFPYYAVSIALEEAGELLVGVIYDPNRDEMFSAVRGEGAALNDEPIRPTTVSSLHDAMVVVSLPVGVNRSHPAVVRFLQVLPVAQTVQRTGSAALNLAYLACGRIDAFFSSSLQPWDAAAGALIVQQAGARITKIDGSPFEIEVADLLASNGTEIHEELQRVLAST